MFCNKCGNEIPEGANICGYCGIPVQQFNPGQQGMNQQNVQSNQNVQNMQNGQMGGRQQNVYGESAPSYSGSSYSGGNQNYQTYNAGYGYGAPVQPMDGGAVGLAIASLISGIVSLLLVCGISAWWLGVVAALLGIVFGAVALGKHMGGKGMAIGGLVCSIVALVLELLVLLVGIGIFAMIFSAMSI